MRRLPRRTASREAFGTRSSFWLLVSEAVDRILLRCSVGGDDSKDEADRARHAERDEHGEEAHDRLDRGEAFDPDADQHADQDARRPAGHADEHRFAQELEEDVLAGGPERAANADLADPFED